MRPCSKSCFSSFNRSTGCPGLLHKQDAISQQPLLSRTIRFKPNSSSRLEVAHLKDADAHDEKRHVESEEDARRLTCLPPCDVIGKKQLPDVEMVAEKTFLEVMEAGDRHQDAVNQDHRECEDGGGLHVATRRPIIETSAPNTAH